MYGGATIGETPRFVRSKYRDWSKEPAKAAQNFIHDGLSLPPSGRIRSITIHPVLGYIYIERAQIDRTKLVNCVVNLVIFERLIGGAAFPDHLIQSLQDPAIDQ